jgi:hypothetical protein
VAAIAAIATHGVFGGAADRSRTPEVDSTAVMARGETRMGVSRVDRATVGSGSVGGPGSRDDFLKAAVLREIVC